MGNPVDHADLSKYEKKGWYEKKYLKAQTTRKCKGKYEALCKTGFRGGRSEAHHVLPSESFKDSLKKVSPENKVYVKWVMHVADWDLNLSANLLGLPTVHSYEQFFQDRVTLKTGGTQKLRKLIKWFNDEFQRSKRQEYLALVRAQSPEGYAIHNPSTWGHDLYSIEVRDWLTSIWDDLSRTQDQHKDDETKALANAARLPPMLTTHARLLRRRLQGRAKANRDAWKKRHDRADQAWYRPFTMVPVPSNPLAGGRNR